MRRRKTPIPKRLPLSPHPDSTIRDYHRSIEKYVRLYIQLVQSGLKDLVPELKDVAADQQLRADSITLSKSQHFDADPNIAKKIEDLLAWVQDELESAFPDAVLRTWSKATLQRLAKQSKTHTTKVAKKVGLEVEPLLHDRGLSDWAKNAVDENVSLIRSIPKEKLETFKNGLVALVTADAPSDQIRKMIQKNFDTTRAKARMIARDQVGKLNADINQYRQQQLGGKRYVWRGVDDERERHDHYLLNDTIQYWSKPPIVDTRTGRRAHPGKDYECRCRAEMVLDDILE